MNDLLEIAVAAHGGLDRWNQVTSVTVGASITGTFWQVKSKGDALGRHDFTIEILGGVPTQLHAAGYRDVDGIIIPATRRAYAWDGDHELVQEPPLVAIDMNEITIR
jgi:hypothetical protein